MLWSWNCSNAQSYANLCDPVDYRMPCFPVHHLPEFAQTHVHWVSDAIQPSHPLVLPSIFPSVRSFLKRQLFISGGRTIRASASVIPMNIQVLPVVIREISAFYSMCQQIIACRLHQRVLINHRELINKTIDIRRVFNWSISRKDRNLCFWGCLYDSVYQSCFGYRNVYFFWIFTELHTQFTSVTESCPALCDPIQVPHTRLHCSSPTPRTCSKSCPLSTW